MSSHCLFILYSLRFVSSQIAEDIPLVEGKLGLKLRACEICITSLVSCTWLRTLDILRMPFCLCKEFSFRFLLELAN